LGVRNEEELTNCGEIDYTDFVVKKLLFTSILLAVLIVPLYPVYAISDDSTVEPKRVATTSAKIPKIEDKKLALTDRLEDKKDKLASRAAMLKEKLSKFRDQSKAKILDRINTELANINKRRTTQMSQNLGRMEEILGKLESKAGNSASASASVMEAINSARTQIDLAKAEVASQSAKDYTVEVSSESASKVDAKKTRDQLHSDLKLAHNTVQDARKAVANAIRTVLSALGGNK
jgi:hypothetical protein